MNMVGAGLGNDINLPAAVVSVLCVIVIGQNAELGDRIQIGDRSGSPIAVLSNDSAVQQEAIVGFPLAVDRECSSIQIARYLGHCKTC